MNFAVTASVFQKLDHYMFTQTVLKCNGILHPRRYRRLLQSFS